MWSYVQYKQIGKEVEQDRRMGRLPQYPKINRMLRREENKGEDDLEKGISGNPSPHTSNNIQPPAPQPYENNKERLSSTEYSPEKDCILVKGRPDNDPLDPRNWPLGSRAKNIIILSLLIFVQAWAGASNSQTNTRASQTYHVSAVAENLGTAMYLFGIGSGCLFVGPLSETIGRNPTYLISTFCYLWFLLGSALSKTFGSQIVCRYFIGLCCSATLGINGASVRDMFRPVKRAFVFPVIAWANVVPPVLAPIVGGWVASRNDIDFRWTEWITLIISAFAFLIAVLFLPETYFPALLKWKAYHLRRVSGDKRFVSENAAKGSFLGRLKHNLPLTVKFLATEPVVMVLGGYLVLLYILLFSFLSGFEYIFKRTYGLTPLQTGECFGSIALGTTVFTLCAPGLYTWARHHTEHIQGAHITPEFRLWPALVTAPLLPISLFWMGFTNKVTISIYSGLGACFTFGIVLAAMYVSAYEYIIDSYGEHAAIALSSITMVRYLISGSMVMAARPMFEGIGVKWTMVFLGCLAVVLMPGPWALYRYGRTLRERSPYAQVDEDEGVGHGDGSSRGQKGRVNTEGG